MPKHRYKKVSQINHDYCPFTRTKKNDERRFNPHSPRAAICYQLHDDLRALHTASFGLDDDKWVVAVNNLKMSLEVAKKAKSAA